MHVHTNLVVGGELRSGSDRVIGAGEGCMQPDHAPAAFTKETVILGQASGCAFGSVAIGDAIGTIHPHTNFGTRLSDDAERPIDCIRRFVMVDDRGTSALERFERAKFGRPVNRVFVERTVETPPHQLEDFHESRRRAGRGWHTSGQGRVQMVMSTHQTRCLVGSERLAHES